MSSTSLDSKDGPSHKKDFSDLSTVSPGNIKSKLQTPSISSSQALSEDPELTTNPGYRAAEAYVRPSPIATAGKLLSSGFDLRNCVFNFKLLAEKSTGQDTPTEVFLPEFHFPKDRCTVEVSGGKWSISTDDADGGMIQRFRWWHAEGEQTLRITGVQRRQNMKLGKEEEEGYIDQCQQSSCAIM